MAHRFYADSELSDRDPGPREPHWRAQSSRIRPMIIEIRMFDFDGPSALGCEERYWPSETPLLIPNVGDKVFMRKENRTVNERIFCYQSDDGKTVDRLEIILNCS
jgi:hypothetical protein